MGRGILPATPLPPPRRLLRRAAIAPTPHPVPTFWLAHAAPTFRKVAGRDADAVDAANAAYSLVPFGAPSHVARILNSFASRPTPRIAHRARMVKDDDDEADANPRDVKRLAEAAGNARHAEPARARSGSAATTDPRDEAHPLRTRRALQLRRATGGGLRAARARCGRGRWDVAGLHDRARAVRDGQAASAVRRRYFRRAGRAQSCRRRCRPACTRAKCRLCYACCRSA